VTATAARRRYTGRGEDRAGEGAAAESAAGTREATLSRRRRRRLLPRDQRVEDYGFRKLFHHESAPDDSGQDLMQRSRPRYPIRPRYWTTERLLLYTVGALSVAFLLFSLILVLSLLGP
jgi:hypothetical protein